MTPRSWVIQMMAMPNSSRKLFTRSMICAWMVTSRAVVGSSAIKHLRRAGERHGDHRTLAHTAGKLVGIIFQRSRHWGYAPFPAVNRAVLACFWSCPYGFPAVPYLAADGMYRVERGHWILENNTDLRTADMSDFFM